MLDKLEVYPYQRVSEPASRRRLTRRGKFRPGKNSGSGRVFLSQGLKQGLKEVIKALLTIENFLLALGALVMARAFILEEILPFIFAYLVAFGFSDKKRSIILTAFAAVGLATVLGGVNFWSYLLTLIILVGVINYIPIPQDKTWWGLPLITMSVIFAARSLFMLVSQISFYTEMIIVFEAIMAGVLTFVFMVAGESFQQGKPMIHFTFEDVAAFLVMGIGIVMGLNDINIFGLSLSGIICRLGVLIAAFLWGSGGGTMVGVMAGVIPSISSNVFTPTLGMYAVSGLLAGLFKNFGRLGVIIGFMLGTLALSLFINPVQSAILGIWETGLACLIFFMLPESLKESLPIQTLGPLKNLKEGESGLVEAQVSEAAKNRIQYLASVFDELSSTFAGEKRSYNNNQTAYLNYLYDEISRGFCETCSHYQTCWGKDCYSTSQQILDIFTLAEMNQQVNYEECPAEFRRRCIYGREMVNTINYLFDHLRLNEYWSDKLEESRDLVAAQLKGVGQIIKGLAEELEIKTEVDYQLREQLLKESRKMGLNIKDLTPVKTGDEPLNLKVIMPACADGKNCDINISPIISGLLGHKMEVSHKNCPRITGRGQCEFTLTRSFTYRVVSGAAQAGKDKICGDSFTIATLKEGKELIALSDGMGVGEKASSESQAAVRLLESLLNSGFDREVALKTINSVLLLRSNSESFATLDLLIIDLYTAEVDFVKIGSAPTFIKRGKRVGTITSNSLPIGIMDNVDIVSEKRVLYPRDMLVMVSDGVLEISPDIGGGLWLEDFLSEVNTNDPQYLAELIINKALSLCQGHPRDDMTAICVYLDI